MKPSSIVCLLALLGASPAFADDVRTHARRRTSAIKIDGRLDEVLWQDAVREIGFVQRYPKFGAKPSSETSFAIYYDDDAIYVGVWAFDAEPASIRSLLTRRDVDANSDAIALGFDSYHDRRTAYVFQLNAAGVQRDMVISDDQNLDDSWDAVWTGDAAITPTGWTAEFRIPLSQLRYPSGSSQEWGLQVLRVIGRTTEQSTWSPWPTNGSEIVSKFGTVDGITGLRPARRLELLPYLTGGVEVMPIEAGDPINARVGGRGNLGIDMKYGLGPAFTLSATLNPDFGQVEADPSQVNLSANELFFAEKRPFFIEGADLFKLPIGNSSNTVEGGFYSRRIGAAPAEPDEPYDYIEQPEATAIYSAAKLTGKTRGGWSIGVFDAVTGEEQAKVALAGEATHDVIVAPLTNYAVARVKRDLRGGLTSVGASLTAVDRKLDGTPLAAILHDQAYTGGAQISHRFAHNAWSADLSILGSYVHGSEAAIARTQQLNRHLFQRPDATHLTLDPTRTSLPGFDLTASIGQFGDTEHWRFGTGFEARSPGLELNDMGFQTSSDRIMQFLWMEHHDNEPGTQVLNWQANHDVFYVSDFSPRLLGFGYECNASAQLVNYWTVGGGCHVLIDRWDPNALRGGPSLRTTNRYSGFVNLTSDQRKRVWASLSANLDHTPTGHAMSGGIDGGVTIQARSNLEIFVGPSWSSRRDALQYVDEAQDTAGTPHYLFGTIDQTTVALTLRVNWTFSPHLALQAYAQPFIASGLYSELKDVDHPGAARFEDRFHTFMGDEARTQGGVISVDRDGDGAVDFAFGKPDFDVRELRSTIVLRWEYRPGSNVYAIWSHGQSSAIDDGRFQLGRDLRGLSEAASENIVMVKANYWIGL